MIEKDRQIAVNKVQHSLYMQYYCTEIPEVWLIQQRNMHTVNITVQCNVFLSALTLLVRWQEEHLVHKKLEWCGAGMVICLERGANDLHMFLLMPLPPHHLCFWKILKNLMPAYLGCPEKRPWKGVIVYSLMKQLVLIGIWIRSHKLSIKMTFSVILIDI